MIPPKYRFLLGKVKTDFAFSNNRIDLATGAFIQSEYNKASDYIAINDNTGFFMLKKPVHQSSANIIYYDSDKKYLGYNVLSKGLEYVPFSTAAYYVITYQYNDTAFSEQDYFAELHISTPIYKEVSKKYAKETNQEFFRISLDGSIKVKSDDYFYIKNSSLEDILIFIIARYENNKWTEYYSGQFSKTDCKFDNSKLLCELKDISTIDEYTNVINKYENTYDLIKLAPAISKINMYKRSLMQVYVRGAGTISNFFGGTYWESDVNTAVDSHEDLINKYYFAYVGNGNEVQVQGSSTEAINGVYAGNSINLTNANNTYKFSLTKVISDGDFYTGHEIGTVYDIRNSNSRAPKTKSGGAGMGLYAEDLYALQLFTYAGSEALYSSEKIFYIENANEIYIGRDDITLNNSTETISLINVFVYNLYRRLLCDVDSIDDKATYDVPYDDFVSDNRNYKKCIGLIGGTFFCTARTVDEPTKYGMNDFGKYFTNKFIPLEAGLGRPLPVSRNSWANASLWYVYDILYEYTEASLRKKYTLRDSYSIADVISVLLKQIDPSIKHEATAEYSRFLYDTTVPIPMARFYVYITQKTNILKGEYDQPAQKAETTLKDIMEMLRDCFRCYWFIEDGKLKIEHISFFMRGGSYNTSQNIQFDFTKLKDQFNKKLALYGQSEVEYDKSDLNQRYEYAWMDDVTELFGGVTIDVNSNYIQKDKSEDINISQFSSDVDYMLFNPSNFSEDGFALLCPVKNGSALELPIIKVNLKDESNTSYDATVQNWYASWIYLINFYMHDMPANNITCNVLSNMYVYDIKKCMKQDIQFVSESDPDYNALLKTENGNGKIESLQINIDTRMVQAELAYTPK